MTTRQFLRRAAALPILLPPFAFLVSWSASRLELPRNDVMEALTGLADLIALAGIISIIPYGGYLAVQLHRLREADASAHWRALWHGPVVVSGVVGVAALAMSLANAGWERGSFGFALLVTSLGLIIGGGYALVIAAGHWVLARTGVVRD